MLVNREVIVTDLPGNICGEEVGREETEKEWGKYEKKKKAVVFK
jgi:hypothetical protein